MAKNEELSLCEKINRALVKEGRKQGWVVGKLKELGIEMSEYKFSRKKIGVWEFKEEELIALEKVLGTKF